MEYTRAHYDAQAAASQTLQQRARGPLYALKKFHNDVKLKLLCQYAKGAGRLLDVACGRGGDIMKWSRASIAHAHGIDISHGEILEARRRYESSSVHTRCTFDVVDTFGTASYEVGAPYNVVSCMFALHYFFETEHILEQFVRNVAANLERGGYFIGCVPDGALVRAHDTNTQHLTIRKLWQGPPRDFGSAYTFALTDTVTSDEHGTRGSVEYLVDEAVLEMAAARHGLYPVTGFSHFHPPANLPGHEASALFATFVFRKH